MNVVTIIPARGGSKSIPKKNIQPIDGKPLIFYSIDYSINCPLVDRTIVSTDSNEIADIALKCGAEIPFLRPKELSLDDTQDFPVIRHALEFLEESQKTKIDLIVLLRPTSPLRPKGLIEKGISLINAYPKSSSLRSVAISKEHPYRQWTKDGDYISGYVTDKNEPYNLPRQKLPKAYFQTGDIEIIKKETITGGSISGERVLPLVMQHSEILDIDYPSDLIFATSHIEKSKRKN